MGGCQNEETKKCGPNERTDQNFRKRTKQNEDKQSIRCGVIQMLKELTEDLNSIKKIVSETKDTLNEIKNDLLGNNNRVDEAENQIYDLEHKEAKTTNQNNKKKKESKKTRIV